MKRELSTKGFVCASLSFALMGFTSTCWGSMLPWLAANHALSISHSGLIFGGFTLFTLVGTSVAQIFGLREDLIWFIRRGILISMIGFLGVVHLTNIHCIIFAACFAGFGYGATGISLLQLLTRSANASHVRMNIASTATGLGALAGPFTISLLGSPRIPLIITVAIGISAISTQVLPGANWRVERISQGKTKLNNKTNLTIVLIGVVFYSGVENSIGAWLPTLIKTNSGSLESGAMGSALFYLFFSLGRFLGIGISKKISAQKIVTFSIFGTFFPFLVVIFTPHHSLLALAISGLFLGPIFPNTSSWIAAKTPGFPLATTALMLAIMSGGLIFPSAIGFILEGFGVGVLIYALTPLLTISVLCFTYSYIKWRD
jgi:fucose permease